MLGAVIFKIMTTRKLVNLIMKSSDHNPYTGKLSESDNVLAAIELAKKFKEFADEGYADEAMDIESSQWVKVINKLESKRLNCA
jgi:ribosomal protein L31